MDHTRHLSIYQIQPTFKVGLVGAGGIGAATALSITKMGVHLLDVWDDDEVSTTNIPTQFHPVGDVGLPKVYSLQRTLEAFSDEVSMKGTVGRVDEQTTFPYFDLLISAVDSITARKLVWDAIHRSSQPAWYLDQRMAAREYQHFLVDMSDQRAVSNYSMLLGSLNEEDVEELHCTEKATFFCAMLAAGHAGNVLCNIVRYEAEPHRLVHYIPTNNLSTFNL